MTFKKSLQRLKEASINEVVKKYALLTSNEFISRSSIIEIAVNSGEVTVMSAYYHLDSGK